MNYFYCIQYRCHWGRNPHAELCKKLRHISHSNEESEAIEAVKEAVELIEEKFSERNYWVEAANIPMSEPITQANMQMVTSVIANTVGERLNAAPGELYVQVLGWSEGRTSALELPGINGGSGFTPFDRSDLLKG